MLLTQAWLPSQRAYILPDAGIAFPGPDNFFDAASPLLRYVLLTIHANCSLPALTASRLATKQVKVGKASTGMRRLSPRRLYTCHIICFGDDVDARCFNPPGGPDLFVLLYPLLY